jgi:multicomponent Na+:H+ antiporter subunit D
MFTESQTILLSLLIPFVGAFGVALAGRWPNLRETVTLTTAVLLAANVWSLIPIVQAGGRPELHLVEMLPGLSIAFKVEPLGMLFGALASGCGSSIRSIRSATCAATTSRTRPGSTPVSRLR